MAGFGNYKGDMTEPSRNFFTITKGVEMTVPARGIFVGTGGTFTARNMVTGVNVTFTAVAGTTLPICTNFIVDSGTADDLVGLG